MKHFRKSAGTASAVLLLVAAGCGASEGGGSGSGGGSGGLGGSGGAAFEIPLTATSIAVGAAHSCALVAGGAVACWGAGAHGQLGDGVLGPDHARAIASLVPGLSGVTALRAGGDTTCALVGGGVECWGDGTFGQLGDGLAADGHASPVPVAVTGLSGVVDLSVTGQNACAALADGTVRCWGRNAPDGWLGFDSADCGPYAIVTGDGGPTLMTIPCEPTPREVSGAHDAVAIVSGGAHTCALTASGDAACWGADHFGQLGDGQSGPDAFHVEPIKIAGISGVQRLALGASHTCAVAGDAAGVRCWGDNAYGQLGLGTNALDSYKIAPTAVTDLVGVVDLHAASRTTCAALADGTVRCWGDTATVLPVSPQKGSALLPTPVPGIGGVVEVRTSGAHACALLGDGTVICWGQDDRGQLGSGNMGLADFSMVPVLAVEEPPG